MKLLLYPFIFYLIAVTAHGNEPIDEQKLFQLIQQNPPSIQSIEASFLGSKMSEAKTKDAYSPTASATTAYIDSEEKSLNTFAPVTSKYKSYEIEVAKPLIYGAQVSAKFFSEKYTNNYLTDATTNGFGIGLSLDLYQDLFGRTGRTSITLTETASKRAELEKKIQLATFSNNIRKLYWALVANAEQKKITMTLLDSSKKQLTQAQRRLRSGVADRGEIARYQSQISSRKASLISLDWQKNQYNRQLMELLPDLAGQELVLGNYDIEEKVSQVMACSMTIGRFRDAPLDHTYYDEIIKSLGEEQNLKNKINQNYDSLDLKLSGEYESTGKSFTNSDAFDDLKDDGRSAYTVGLSLSIPFGSAKKNTREIQEKIDQRRFEAGKKQNLGKYKAFHAQTVKAVTLLREIVANQEQNTKYLNESLKVSKTKYNQARITVQQLVQEQDSYLQSNLDVISTKLTIIHLFLDYFNVFTETPCKLNRKS